MCIYIYSLRKGTIMSHLLYFKPHPSKSRICKHTTQSDHNNEVTDKTETDSRRLSHPQRIKATYFFLRKSPVQLTPGRSTLVELPITHSLCLLVSSKSSVPPLDILASFLSEKKSHTHKTPQILKVPQLRKDPSALPCLLERSCYRHG